MRNTGALGLPPGVSLLERGWLSSNSVVLLGHHDAAVVDSGYWTHAQQTVSLVTAAIGSLPLRTLVNTHLHSDHCGGNAALQQHFPAVQTWIPPGLAAAVRQWDPIALTYAPTGQHCPRFSADRLLAPGSVVRLGLADWEVHGAPGHDPHSVILFEPASRTLISADALWENGFGVVFPELEGESAFDEVEQTLNAIERLRPAQVLPGHGAAFSDVSGALARARSRLQAYVTRPERHAAHAAKVLLKFKLLELQRCPRSEFVAWAESAAYFRVVHEKWFGREPLGAWILGLLAQMEQSGTIAADGEHLTNP